MHKVAKKEEFIKAWLKQSLGSKRFSGVQLIPISQSDKISSVLEKTRLTGVGGKYPTAIIDKNSLKVVYAHI
jgi:hypothetical protein